MHDYSLDPLSRMRTRGSLARADMTFTTFSLFQIPKSINITHHAPWKKRCGHPLQAEKEYFLWWWEKLRIGWGALMQRGGPPSGWRRWHRQANVHPHPAVAMKRGEQHWNDVRDMWHGDTIETSYFQKMLLACCNKSRAVWRTHTWPSIPKRTADLDPAEVAVSEHGDLRGKGRDVWSRNQTQQTKTLVAR